jgi:hypothetical protein
MALLTFGTNATNTLSAFQWNNDNAVANTALINNAIKTQGTVQRNEPAAFTNNGFLFVPNRGIIKLIAGDWIAIGSTGMPFVMSNRGKVADFTSA